LPKIIVNFSHERLQRHIEADDDEAGQKRYMHHAAQKVDYKRNLHWRYDKIRQIK
jgi:hypothetical protein